MRLGDMIETKRGIWVVAGIEEVGDNPWGARLGFYATICRFHRGELIVFRNHQFALWSGLVGPMRFERGDPVTVNREGGIVRRDNGRTIDVLLNPRSRQFTTGGKPRADCFPRAVDRVNLTLEMLNNGWIGNAPIRDAKPSEV